MERIVLRASRRYLARKLALCAAASWPPARRFSTSARFACLGGVWCSWEAATR